MATKKRNESEPDRQFVDRWTSDGAGIVMLNSGSNQAKKKPAAKKSSGSSSSKGKGKKA